MSFLAYPTHVAWPLWSHVPIPERLHPFASLNNQVYQACAPTEILQVCQSSRSGICVLHRRLLCGGLRLGAAVRTQADWRVPLLFTLASRVYTVNGWHVCRSYYVSFPCANSSCYPPHLLTQRYALSEKKEQENEQKPHQKVTITSKSQEDQNKMLKQNKKPLKE